MGLDNPKAGFNHATEYTVAGLPYVTSSQAPLSGSVLRIDFPKITRALTIRNHDAATKYLRIGFTARGVVTSGNHYSLNGGETVRLELRLKSVFFSGDTTLCPFSIVAELTNIEAIDMPTLTGSIWQGVGLSVSSG